MTAPKVIDIRQSIAASRARRRGWRLIEQETQPDGRRMLHYRHPDGGRVSIAPDGTVCGGVR